MSIRPNELHIGNQMNEFAYCHHISMTWTRFELWSHLLDGWFRFSDGMEDET
jgi:hypothetical protein